MSSAIILLKLSTSEEVITKIKTENKNHYILERPRTLAPIQAENGTVQIAMFHWVMGAQDPSTKFESDVRLEKSAVVGLVTEPPKALVDMYLTKTSGIKIVTG